MTTTTTTPEADPVEGALAPPPLADASADADTESASGGDPSDGEEAPSSSASAATPPEEVQKDVFAELGEYDRAAAATSHTADPLDLGLGQMPDDPLAFTASMGMSQSYDGGAQAAQRASAHAPTAPLETLEDLFAEFPKLATGEYVLRVERTSPTSFKTVPCAGYLDDLTGVITMDDFRRRFGGGKYQLTVLGSKQSEMDHGGYKQRTLAKLTIMIPGVPNLGEDDDMSSHTRFGAVRGTNGQIEHTRLKLESDRETELRHENRELNDRVLKLTAEHSRGPDLSQLRDYTRDQVETIQAQHAETIHMMRRDIEEKARRLETLSAELDRQKEMHQELQANHQAEVFKERSARIEAAQKEETEKIKALREQHSERVASIEREHREKYERLTDDHRRSLDEAQKRFEDQRRDQQDRHERDRLHESREHERQMGAQKAQYEQQISHLTQMFESRLSEAQRANERETRSLKDNYNAQLQAFRLAEESKTTATKLTADSQVNMHTIRMQSLEAESAGLRAENERLRAELDSHHKGPLEHITEARSLIEAIGGGGGEAPAADWKANLAQAFRGVADKLPEIAQRVTETRAHNQAMHAAAAQAAARPPMGPAQFAQNQAAPPPVRRMHPSPPPGMGNSPYEGPADPNAAPMSASPLGHAGLDYQFQSAPLGANSFMAPEHYFDPMATPPLNDQQQPPPHQQAAAAPVQQQVVHFETSQAPAPPPAQPPTAPPAQATPPQPPPLSPDAPPAAAEPMSMELRPPHEHPAPNEPPPDTALAPPQPEPPALDAETLAMLADDERVGELIAELAQAERNPLISPKAFAAGLIEEAGPDVAYLLVTRLQGPDAFIAMLKQVGAPYRNLYTRDGRQYVAECWQHVIGMLQQMQQQPAPAG